MVKFHWGSIYTPSTRSTQYGILFRGLIEGDVDAMSHAGSIIASSSVEPFCGGRSDISEQAHYQLVK
jgi:hypothetical protein